MRQWGRGTRAAVAQRARGKCVVIDKPSDARLRNQASVIEQDVRKASAFEWYVSFVLSPPTPSNEPCSTQSTVRTEDTCGLVSEGFQDGRRSGRSPNPPTMHM